eukprot:12413622-Karenia_brevis.AAC.1
MRVHRPGGQRQARRAKAKAKTKVKVRTKAKIKAKERARVKAKEKTKAGAKVMDAKEMDVPSSQPPNLSPNPSRVPRQKRKQRPRRIRVEEEVESMVMLPLLRK